tara:strand:- start:717 stop:944 length:228 start_codon:yes stop_codon:yes gene_type:complete
MSKFEQFKLFCTIQLQNINQREMQIRKELQDLQIQREYLASFLQDLQADAIQNNLQFNETEVEILKSLLIKTDTE